MKKLSHLVLATNNPGKRNELERMLTGMGITVHTPETLGLELVSPEETGTSYRENAEIKARAAFEAYHPLLSKRLEGPIGYFGEDSGLYVDELPGVLGIQSNRWFEGSEAERNTELLKRLMDIRIDKRSGRYTCAIVVFDGTDYVEVGGVCEVRISLEPHGESGFGYDPITVPVYKSSRRPIYVERGTRRGLTMAEINPKQKDRVSHRGKALRELRKKLVAS